MTAPLDSILVDWEQFLNDKLGAPKRGTVLRMMFDMALQTPPEEMMEHYPWMRAAFEDPDAEALRLRTTSDIATLRDEELVQVQAPMHKHYGFFLSVENLVVFMRELLTHIPLHKVKRVVDVGCGPCSYTSFLLSRGLLDADIKAVDPSPEMLVRAQEVAEELGVAFRTELLQGWGYALPVPDGFADLTLIIDSLHWMKRWRETLREAARVTAPDGRLFISYSTCSPRMQIDPMQVVEILAQSGMNPEQVMHFGGEASNTGRSLIIASKRKAFGIIAPGAITY